MCNETYLPTTTVLPSLLNLTSDIHCLASECSATLITGYLAGSAVENIRSIPPPVSLPRPTRPPYPTARSNPVGLHGPRYTMVSIGEVK
jgi:hypothetical protein